MGHVQRTPANPSLIVVIGGGFAGVRAATGLPGRGAAIAPVDRQYHVFQPLLYELPTAMLSPRDTAAPRRRRGVAEIGDCHFDGAVARLVCLAVYPVELVGFGNRASALLQWMWSLATLDAGVRLITRDDLVCNALPIAAPPRVERRQAFRQA